MSWIQCLRFSKLDGPGDDLIKHFPVIDDISFLGGNSEILDGQKRYHQDQTILTQTNSLEV